MPRYKDQNLLSFLDGVPKDLLKKYFTQDGYQSLNLTSFDSKNLIKFFHKNTANPLIEKILEELSQMYDISNTSMNLVVTAIKRCKIETTGKESREELIMKVFLNDTKAFYYVHDKYCLFNSSSKFSEHNISADGFELTDDKLKEFQLLISEFYADLAKGGECRVRHYVEGDLTTIVIRRGSYKRSQPIWSEGGTRTILFRPVTQDILIYNKKTSTLQIKAPYQKDRDNYLNTFAEVIIEDPKQAEREDRDMTYSLKPLQDGKFSFKGNDDIESIVLKEVKLTIAGSKKPYIFIRSEDVLETLQEEEFERLRSNQAIWFTQNSLSG
ncbi:MAG: hypothetical protein H7A34_01665 [bacterium]|nr:hypothetical protein [bacterium]